MGGNLEPRGIALLDSCENNRKLGVDHIGISRDCDQVSEKLNSFGISQGSISVRVFGCEFVEDFWKYVHHIDDFGTDALSPAFNRIVRR